jgi:hypothetical protein
MIGGQNNIFAREWNIYMNSRNCIAIKHLEKINRIDFDWTAWLVKRCTSYTSQELNFHSALFTQKKISAPICGNLGSKDILTNFGKTEKF